MNIFFYAIQENPQARNVFNWLQSLHPPLNVQILPSACGFKSRESMNVRNGDLLIIFLRDQEELESFVTLRDECQNYKLYLIFQEDNPTLIKAGLLFNPIHYSSVEKKYINAEITIRKILKQNTKIQHRSV